MEVSPPENACSLRPSEAKNLFRRNGYYGTTSGFCRGHLQANLLVLPETLADEFEEFCQQNSGPCPLLYRSKAGECAAPPLAQDSDVKTDLPRYRIYSNGKLVDDVLDLGGFEMSWSDKTSFYLGCSFTFEDALVSNGVAIRNAELRLNVAMYLTSIKLNQVGVFEGNMIVSMRPIKKSQLGQAVCLSAQYLTSHGAPIHIGYPVHIGIMDLSQPIVPTRTDVEDDEVPVFWACGVSAQEAVKKAAPPLAFSHYPGSMFIADTPVKPHPLTDRIEVVPLSRDGQPFYASVLESKSVDKILQMEAIILEDPRNQGVRHLHQQGGLLKSVLSLSHANKIALTATGHVLPGGKHREIDGMLGTLFICQSLTALGKEVTLLCDNDSLPLYQSCVDDMRKCGALKLPITVTPFSEAFQMAEKASADGHLWDCIVSVGGAGNSKFDGLDDKVMTVESMDALVLKAASNPVVATVAVGDGEGDVGVGRSKAACDFMVAAGVSSWGAYAISLGLYVVSCHSPMHFRYKSYAINVKQFFAESGLDAFIPTSDQFKTFAGYLCDRGYFDGPSSGLQDFTTNIQNHEDMITKLINSVEQK